ncbi:MAG: hypothetical protein K2Q20_01910 [Phycisphaerales bacterium]|nr:hypothetical protein [Phycisphaerales bacterium]
MKTFMSVAALLLAAATSASAGIIHDSQGFEAPLFTSGPIDGQNGWAVDPAGQTLHQVTGAVGATSPIGSQMLRAQQGVTSTRYSWVDLSAGIAARPIGEDWIWNRFDINVPVANTATSTFGVFAFNATGGIIGGVQVRGSNGLLFVTLDPDGAGPAAFGNYTLGTPALAVPRGQWINLGVAVNVATNAIAITSGSSIVFQGVAAPGSAATLSDFDIFSAASATLTDSVYFDNYSVTSESVVPAPGAFALVGLGGLLAARRRRN